jgi:glycosyltransferase involved in cell wall biosynthesis
MTKYLAPTAEEQRVRVCMLVTTTYTHDSRVRRAAEALAQDGHDVHVICCYSRTADTREQTIADVTIHRVAREIRDLPGWLLVRLRMRRTPPPHGGHRGLSAGKRHATRAVTWLRAMASPALLLLRWHRTSRMRRKVRALRPAIIHAHDPDTLPVVRTVVRRGAKLVYDAHELTSGRADQFFWERWLDLRRERTWIPRADITITVSQSIGSILDERHGVKTLLVRNIPHPASTEQPPLFDLRSRIGVAGSTRVLLYQGQRAPGRGLVSLLQAHAMVPGPHLVFLGSASRGVDAEVHGLIEKLDLASRTHFLEPVESRVLLPLTAQADVGICLIDPISESFRLSLPNKLFEYLVAGIPVIASDILEIARIVRACSGGVLCDPSDPGSIASAIETVDSPPDPALVPNAEDELRRLVESYRTLT